jgi:hypothetical protein
MFFFFPGVPIVDKGYLLEDGQLLPAKIFLISFLFQLQFLGVTREGPLVFLVSLHQLLFCSQFLFLLAVEYFFLSG